MAFNPGFPGLIGEVRKVVGRMAYEEMERMRALGSDVPTVSGRQLLSMADVIKRTSLSRSSIYTLLKKVQFPRRVRCGPTSRIAFLATDVEAWIADQERIASIGGR